MINGNDASEAFAGDIVLAAGQNFRIRVDQANNKIYFDCIDADGFTEECVCDDLDTQAPCIRTINGVGPNANGELTLRGTSCVEIQGGINSITLDDSCAEPCCDCRELQVISDQLESLLNDVTNLEIVAERLDGTLQNIQGNILASKSTGIPR